MKHTFWIFMLLRLFLLLFFTVTCSSLSKKKNVFVKFVGEQTLKKGLQFNNLKVGGLSEIVFDKKSGLFFVLSDDKKNHRFYKLSLFTKPSYKFKIEEQVLLKSPGKQRLDIKMDPEALILYGENDLFIASEGQQVFNKHDPTQIFKFDQKGLLKKAWPVPEVFWNQKKGRKFGQKENKGFESLAINRSANLLWTATEKSLKQDHSRYGEVVRLSAFDISSRKLVLQYPYFLKSKESGLTALEFVGFRTFLALERAYKKGDKSHINEIYLFLVDCKKASPIQDQMSLKNDFKPCYKKQIWSSKEEDLLANVDNLEALTLGPSLREGIRLLVLASDNNFNDNKKNQFLFFEFMD